MSVRMAHKLNQTVMNPTNIQRASAKMTFSLFCDSTAAAFKYYSAHGHSEWMQTSIFISYMTNFVKLCNIRSKDVGVRTRDVLKLPFSSVEDDRLNVLLEYADLSVDNCSFKRLRVSLCFDWFPTERHS